MLLLFSNFGDLICKEFSRVFMISISFALYSSAIVIVEEDTLAYYAAYGKDEKMPELMSVIGFNSDNYDDCKTVGIPLIT